ncbi:recombinase family protein [Isoptericola halotolerans]|uniref:recombinase family protein n=1 Tax=Isoptericola halotolerans TaxID=300560 RepID=UPI00388F53EE
MSTTTRKRAVLYTRLSVQGDETSTSISRQEDDLRALAAREGWVVVRVLVDEGVSGRQARANADEAVEMLVEGRADVLAVWEFDRFTRQGLGALAGLMDTLEARPGAQFVALQDGLRSDSTAWRMVAGMLAEVAWMESDNISLRVKSDRAARLRAGLWGGGRIPYGYRPVEVPRGKRLVQEPQEAAVVREIRDQLLDEVSPWIVAGDLTERGVPSPNSAARRALIAGRQAEGLNTGSWGHTVIVRMLTGDPLLGRQQERGETVRNSRGEPVLVSKPILEQRESDALRAMFPWALSSGGRKKRSPRLLTGLVRCSECGARFYTRTHKARNAVDYQHPMPVREGGKCPGATSVRARDLEDAVVSQFLDAVGRNPHAVERLVETGESEGALVEVEAALTAASAALLAADSDGAEAAALSRISALKTERARLRKTPARSVRRELVPTGRTVAEEYSLAPTDDDRRSLIGGWLEAVEPRPIGSGRGPRGKINGDRVSLIVRVDEDGEHVRKTVPLRVE